MASEATTTRAEMRAETNVGRVVGGLALLLPLVILWISALLLPTLRTLDLSRQNVTPTRPGTSVGLDNYRRLFDDRVFAAASGFTALITIERVLVVAIVPLLLALALNEFGRVVRVPVRLLFTIPLALFAPVSVALMWALAYNPQFGLFADGRPILADPARARWALLRMDALTTFGLACGIGLIVYLIALRGPGAAAPAGRRVGPPLLCAWLITLCATIALAIQSFTPAFVATRGGPANRTTTLALLEYAQAFQNLRLGQGAAVATVIAIIPALLGVAVAILVATSGLRLVVVPAGRPGGLLSPSGKPIAAVALGLVAFVAVVACVYGALPTIWTGLASLKERAEVLARPGSFLPASPSFDAYVRLDRALPGTRELGNTVLPVALSILLVQLPIAYLAALGIGALRPLGRWSEWLLVPFGPWLFITAVPLGIANFEGLSRAGGLNSFFGLCPPATATLPLLFVLTLGFKGGAEAWEAARAAGEPGGFFRLVILPTLPLAALLAAAAILINMQDLFWPLIAANRPTLRTIPVTLVQLNQQFATDVPLIAAAIWRSGLPRFLFFLFLFGLFQVFYLDRLALVTGRMDTPPPAEAAR